MPFVHQVGEGAKLGNDEAGMLLAGNGHQIGGTGVSEGNLVAGNGIGLRIGDAQAMKVEGNIIGTNPALATGLGNAIGVDIDASDDLTLGGLAPGAGNVITGSTFAGVRLASGQRNALLRNRIYGNVEYPIDLGPIEGPNPNDPVDLDAGPNGGQNHPEIVSAVDSEGSLQIAGVLRSRPDTEYRIEYFQAPACHASGFGEATAFLGAGQVVTDAQGEAVLAANFIAPSTGVVTATATDPLGNTSEFGNCIAAGPPSPGEIGFLAFSTFAYEDVGVAQVVITRSKGVSGAVGVTFTTKNTANAQPDSDFLPVTTTIEFADGETMKIVEVPIISDGIDEGQEQIDIELSSPTGGAVLGAIATGKIEIYDHDPNDVRYGIDDVVVPELVGGESQAVFTVTLGANADTRSIDYSTADGTAVAGLDYVATSGTLTFAPGETTKTVEVQVLGDEVSEDVEFFELRLSDDDPQIRPLREVGIGAISDSPPARIFADGFED